MSSILRWWHVGWLSSSSSISHSGIANFWIGLVIFFDSQLRPSTILGKSSVFDLMTLVTIPFFHKSFILFSSFMNKIIPSLILYGFFSSHFLVGLRFCRYKAVQLVRKFFIVFVLWLYSSSKLGSLPVYSPIGSISLPIVRRDGEIGFMSSMLSVLRNPIGL